MPDVGLAENSRVEVQDIGARHELVVKPEVPVVSPELRIDLVPEQQVLKDVLQDREMSTDQAVEDVRSDVEVRPVSAEVGEDVLAFVLFGEVADDLAIAVTLIEPVAPTECSHALVGAEAIIDGEIRALGTARGKCGDIGIETAANPPVGGLSIRMRYA